MAMNSKYAWIIWFFLIFVLGYVNFLMNKFEGQLALPSNRNNEDKYCTNIMSNESWRVCDGIKDCLDGSDESDKRCAQIEYETKTACGRLYNMSQKLNKNGQNVLVQMVPWHVGIYRLNKNNSNYDLICGGSIISSNLVVSAAQCFWKKNMTFNRILINIDQYKFRVGNYKKNEEIVYLKEDYYGDRAFHAEDIAIIVFKYRISFSDNVAPVCIDWNGKYNEVNGDEGKLVGWRRGNNGDLSPILLEKSLPYIDRRSCRDMVTNEYLPYYVTYDKFCAGSESEEEVNVVYSGVGLSFYHNNSYYLTGVMSIKYPENNSIPAFTDVKKHMKWIHRLYNRYKRRAESSSSANTKDKFDCTNGVSIEKSWICDGLKDCSDGSDETNQLCVQNENGTTITTDCGIVKNKKNITKMNQKDLYKSAPWNVALYQINAENSGYDFFCGGSLISQKLVVSAAHCFWKIDMPSNRTITDVSQYRVGVGQYNRIVTTNDHNQIIDVEIVYLKEDYHGRSLFYAEDIAIIVLKKKIDFLYYFNPICIDWDGKYNEANGDIGKIFGWGRSENGDPSPILSEKSLPYINRRSCRDMFTNRFFQYVTYDKFCAGYESVSGQGVSKGYGGAALSFSHSSRYYLSGVTSVKDSESNNSIATFTEVKFHIEWIRRLYNKYK